MYFKQEIGKSGEDLATDYLQKQGYEIIQRNYFCRQGEIDIIAREKDEFVFIEVKTRRTSNFGSPIDAIDAYKIEHFKKSVSYYVYSHHLENCFIRLDAIEVLLQNQRVVIHHIKQIV